MEETPTQANQPVPIDAKPAQKQVRRMVRKPPNKQFKHPNQKKLTDFTVKPYPTDLTKGALDKMGSFRWNKPGDMLEWMHEVWSNKENQLRVYLYRQKPICSYDQSSGDDQDERGNAIAIWNEWPWDNDDYHSGMLLNFGGGSYLIIAKDRPANRQICSYSEWEFPITVNHPPHIRVDDVIVDSVHNKSFIGWARNNCVLFPNDKGYTPGQFVHQAVRARGDNDNEMMMNNPINQAVQEAAGGLIKDAITNMKNPPAQQAQQQHSAVDAEAARASIEMVKNTADYVVKQNEREGTSTMTLLNTLLPLITKRDAPAVDTGMSMLVEILRDREKDMARRLEKMEERAFTVPLPPLPKDPLDEIVRMKTLMTELGFSQRGGNSTREPEAAAPQGLLEMFAEKGPEWIQSLTGAFQVYMQTQMQITQMQLQAQARANGQAVPPQQFQQQPPQQFNQPPPPPSSPQGQRPPQQQHPQGPKASANEDARAAIDADPNVRAVGLNFDSLVNLFHPELDGMYRVIIAEIAEAASIISKEQVADLEEQSEIFKDAGCSLALWYTKIPDENGNRGEAHGSYNVMIGAKPILIKALMSYKPIWAIMSGLTAILQNAFIDGFCDLKWIENSASEEDEDSGPDNIGPVIEMTKVN